MKPKIKFSLQHLVFSLAAAALVLLPGCGTVTPGPTPSPIPIAFTPAQIQDDAEGGTVLFFTAFPKYLPAAQQVVAALSPFITNGAANPAAISNALANLQLPAGQFAPLEKYLLKKINADLQVNWGLVDNTTFTADIAAAVQGVQAGINDFNVQLRIKSLKSKEVRFHELQQQYDAATTDAAREAIFALLEGVRDEIAVDLKDYLDVNTPLFARLTD